MRKPAKKYFMPSFGPKSIMHMRQWMDSGAKASDMVRWIKTEYAKAEDDRMREHLGRMLASAMTAAETFSARRLAVKCAEMFAIPTVKDKTVAEDMMSAMWRVNGCKPFEWLETFNPYFIKSCPNPSMVSAVETVSKVFSPEDNRCLLTVSPRHKVYFMRDAKGNSWLIAMNHCNTDILVDEETFRCDPPLYFTERSHFLSPVWIVKQVSAILEYILMRIGYPPMPVFKRVIFEESGAHLINEDAYVGCKDWNGVDVITLHKTKEEIFPARPIPVVNPEADSYGAEHSMEMMLYWAVMSTAAVVEAFDIAKHWEISRSMIEEWCRKRCIFPPDDWTEIVLHESDDEDDSII